MSSHMKYFTDARFIEAYIKLESTDEDSCGFVYIESEADKHFWGTLLEQYAKRKYTFKFKTKEKCCVRGKRTLEELYLTANEKALVAVDSDFDYMSPNRSDYAKNLNRNRFVLQTYAYAVENILLDYIRLDDCLEKHYYYFESSERQFSGFLNAYSNCLYAPLLKYLYLMDMAVELPFNEDEFHKKIIPENIVVSYENNDLTTLSLELSQLDRQLTPLISNMDAFFNYVHLTRYKGLTQENCYKFIRGHDVENRIIYPIARYIKKILIEKEVSRLKGEFGSHELGGKLKEVRQHFEVKKNFKTLINCIPFCKADTIYEKICDNIKSLGI